MVLARLSLLHSKNVPARRARNVSVELVIRVFKSRSDDSDSIGFICFLPDCEVSITEVLSVGASVDVEDIFPRRSNSVSALNFSGDFESEMSVGFSKSISSEWSDFTAILESLAVFESVAWIRGIVTWFRLIRPR